MCFNISLSRPDQEVSDRYDASFDRKDRFEPIFHSSAFGLPEHPLICMDDPRTFTYGKWGLIPRWVKSRQGAEKIRFQTLNARSETIFEKPSFRQAVVENRCLIPVDGFFEFREVNGRKFPYHIRMKDKRIFSLAGIYEDNGLSAEGRERTFSIVTTEANPLMTKIHNTKMRMPVILSGENEIKWLDGNASMDDMRSMVGPYDGDDLEAYPVSRLLTEKGARSNVPGILDRVEYRELDFKDLDSFT